MKKDPVEEALTEAQIQAVRKTVAYLITTYSAAREVAEEGESGTVDNLLTILRTIEERPDMILGPGSSDAVAAEKRYAARILVSVVNVISERGVLLSQSAAASAEMGFNMLSQHGMVAALTWVNKLCVEYASGLDPDLKIEFVDPNSPEGKERLNQVREADADAKSVDEELEEALG